MARTLRFRTRGDGPCPQGVRFMPVFSAGQNGGGGELRNIGKVTQSVSNSIGRVVYKLKSYTVASSARATVCFVRRISFYALRQNYTFVLQYRCTL